MKREWRQFVYIIIAVIFTISVTSPARATPIGVTLDDSTGNRIVGANGLNWLAPAATTNRSVVAVRLGFSDSTDLVFDYRYATAADLEALYASYGIASTGGSTIFDPAVVARVMGFLDDFGDTFATGSIRWVEGVMDEVLSPTIPDTALLDSVPQVVAWLGVPRAMVSGAERCCWNVGDSRYYTGHWLVRASGLGPRAPFPNQAP